MTSSFLPITHAEALERGWEQLDFVYIIGDAYVDHPSFGAAIISRVIESLGFSIGIISQPVADRDYMEFGKPRYAFLVTGGNIDSMVAHYTAAKRRRSDDAYTPGGKAGRRPDRATIVYSRKLRQLYPDSNIVIGGLEASLRRFAHYDYWDDAVRPSILLDSQADLLLYGMGEKVITQLTQRLRQGEALETIRDLRGCCYLCRQEEIPQDSVSCASFHKVSENKESYAKAHQIQTEWQDAVYGKTIVQKQTDTLYLVQNPPMPSLTREELDEVFDLPFTRTYHPSYEAMGGVDAIKEVEFSIIQNRGCFGNCNFCAITFHQGRQVVSRSEQSILHEAEEMTHNPHFKGYIHDVGGPTADFRYPSCKKQLKYGLCQNRKCLAPKPCPQLEIDHMEYVELLRKLRRIKGVKKVFVRSGIRYDYLNADPNPTFLQELVKYHISGQLKVAPEHCVNHVLDKMGKPHIQDFDRFCKRFYEETKRIGKEQYLVPYLMSSHPGCTIADAVERVAAKYGSVIVTDPTTGEILAACSYPTYDQNDLEHASNADLNLRVVTDVYEPGSVFKPLVVAGGIEAGAITATTSFNVPPMVMSGDDEVYDVDKRDFAMDMDIREILRRSSNTGMVLVGERIGADNFDESVIKRFKFGESSGIDFPGQSLGIIKERDEYDGASVTSMSFGQSLAVEPVQVVRAMSSIANKGVMTTPHFLKMRAGEEVDWTDGEERAISEETAATLADMMRTVVDEGTGELAQVPGYEVSGKTGTAQRAGEDGTGYQENNNMASFLGFVSTIDPRVMCYVTLDGTAAQSYAATPVFKTVMETALPTLGIKPTR